MVRLEPYGIPYAFVVRPLYIFCYFHTNVIYFYRFSFTAKSRKSLFASLLILLSPNFHLCSRMERRRSAAIVATYLLSMHETKSSIQFQAAFSKPNSLQICNTQTIRLDSIRFDSFGRRSFNRKKYKRTSDKNDVSINLFRDSKGYYDCINVMEI